ncbi:unnamed protein product [Rotaria sordida]|uniref:Pentapeptide repeat-containing protein n=1 Tax=Rotaria sordida TaxID=392033 RepID=A0A815P4S5_9BILA|nr:unnamed protein product [Rotaria sordida]CAF4064042.1 unnamed protein product [Rotaria sordida]
MSNTNGSEKTEKSNSSRVISNTSGRTISKLVSSIIVPLLIGMATVLISVVQLDIASKQRTQDLLIANEEREQDLHIADALQQDLVLAAYIEQMSELMLTSNFTINNTIIANISNLIHHNQPHIRLVDAELDNIDLSDSNHVQGRYRSELTELPFKRTSLNYASFAHRTIVNGIFEEASLIGANFTNCRFTSTSFFGAILRYANFQNASSKDYINFESADLFGSNISDEMLFNAISIDGANLPNGTRGVRRNFLINGDAELSDCQTNTSMHSSWHIEQISGNVHLSVMSYQANRNVIFPRNSRVSTDQCFYAALGQQGQIMMRQEINLTSLAHLPISQGNVVLLFKLFCAPVGINNDNQKFVKLHVEQFDRMGVSLHNYTKSKI